MNCPSTLRAVAFDGARLETNRHEQFCRRGGRAFDKIDRLATAAFAHQGAQVVAWMLRLRVAA